MTKTVTRSDYIRTYISNIPDNEEVITGNVARALREDTGLVSNIVGDLRDAGKLHKVSEERSSGGFRYRKVHKRDSQPKSSPKNAFAAQLLSSFTDYELIEEVKRRKSA